MISQMKSTQLLLTNNLWLCTTKKALPSGGAFFVLLPNCRSNHLAEWKRKKQAQHHQACFVLVVPTGIEPVTRGFSVLCSTN